MIDRQLAHYRITAKIGEGGMGEVFRARDTKLDRDVALKVLPAATAENPARLRRFTQEAKTVAGLNHPNIVTLYSVDEADGVYFLTMELVVGKTLGRLIPADGLPLEGILDVAIPIADALATAHARGIVHRDLKPGNVMISDDGGRVKVLDFGLAKLTVADPDDDTDPGEALTRTHEGVVLGTPHYMSPEQARAETVDHRADIFSLGVILFEAATGKRPFEGKSSIELLSAVLRDDPPDVSEIRPRLPVRLGEIIRKCLAKNPDDRYASARDLLDELKALKLDLVSGSVSLDRPFRLTAAKRSSSRRTAFAVLGVLALVAIAAIVVLRPKDGETTSPAPTRLKVAVLPFENLGSAEDEYFADGVTDEITSRLSRVGDLGVISRTSARVYKGTKKSLREVGGELHTDFVLEGTIRWDKSTPPGRVRITPRLIRVTDDTQLWSDNFEREVTEVFSVQAEIATRITNALGVTLLANEREALAARPTDDIDAYQAYLQGMKQLRAPGFGRESFARGVRMFERAVELDEGFALAWARLGSMNARMVHYGFDRSPERIARTRDVIDRALELAPDLAEAHLALGQYYYWCTREYDRALEALEAARAIEPNNSEIWLTAAYVNRRQGDFDAALDFLERDRELSPIDPNAAVALGETYGVLRRYADGERAFRSAIALAPDDPYPYTELALLYLRWRGDTAAARATLETLPPVDNSELCRVHFFVELLDRRYDAALNRLAACPGSSVEAGAFFIPIDLFRAQTLHGMGEDARASAAFETTRALLEAKLALAPDDHRIHAALAQAYAGLGRDDDAVSHGRRAVELYPLSEDALEAPVPRIQLAMTYTMVGDLDAAIAELDAMLSIPSILSVAWLEADPRWDALRGHAEFATLLDRHRAVR